MPIYEYRCRACSADFEKYVPGAAATVACPSCASGDITRKLSLFGMRSEGGGDGASASPEIAKKGKKIKEDIDKLLDEIDDILEENAEEFVKSYVQRGGE